MLTCPKETPILPEVDQEVASIEIQDINRNLENGRIDDLIASLAQENYETNHYQVGIAVGRHGGNYLPPFEVQQKFLSLLLEQDAENPFLEEFLSTYGFPIWELTTANGVMIGDPIYLGSQEVPPGECYTIYGRSTAGGGANYTPFIPSNPANEGNEHIIDSLNENLLYAKDVLAEFTGIENELANLISDIFDYNEIINLTVSDGNPGAGDAMPSGNPLATTLMTYNPGISQWTAEALAWEGLQGTMAWNNLSQVQKNDIGLINMDARCEASTEYIGNNNFQEC